MSKTENEEIVKKRNGTFNGRPANTPNNRSLKWKIVMYDKETSKIKEGKYTSVAELNKDMGLNLKNELVNRICNRYRVDLDAKRGEHSFLHRWGHIQIEKINEPILEAIKNNKQYQKERYYRLKEMKQREKNENKID